MFRSLFFPLLFSLLLAPACAMAQASIGFWNVENLFDTIDTPLHDDQEFTPRGANHWDSERYNTKIAHLARVLDEMNLDVVGLCEVEGEGVLRDLISATRTDYAYIRLPTNDGRGIDQALLYKGDKFFPGRPRMVSSGFSRGFLYVPGELAGEPVDLVVCHMPSMVNDRPMRTRAYRALARFVAGLPCPIVIGDMNAVPTDAMVESLGLHGPLLEAARKGHGSYAYDGQWQMLDQILVGDSLAGRVALAGVFIADYLLQQEPSRYRGYPWRTFSGQRYLGGYSDHLPVFLFLEKGTRRKEKGF